MMRIAGVLAGLLLTLLSAASYSAVRAATVSAHVADMDIRVLLLQLAETAGCDLLLAEGVEGRVSTKLMPGKPRDTLLALINARGWVVREQTLPSKRKLIWVGTGDDAAQCSKRVKCTCRCKRNFGACSTRQPAIWRSGCRVQALSDCLGRVGA